MTKIFHARRYGRSTEIQNKFRRKKLHRTNQGSKFLRGSFINTGHDMIIIRMLKLHGPSLCKPLSIIFKLCLRQMKFPMEWKKTNVVPIQKKKKNDKQCIENYRPVSLLLICSKIFERLLFNKLYKFFNENDILSSNQ